MNTLNNGYPVFDQILIQLNKYLMFSGLVNDCNLAD